MKGPKHWGELKKEKLAKETKVMLTIDLVQFLYWHRLKDSVPMSEAINRALRHYKEHYEHKELPKEE